MRPVPPPYLPIPMALLGRKPALPQDLLLWGWLRLREGPGPTPLPAKAYIARCLKVGRDTVTGALDRLSRTAPPLVVLRPGRGADGRPHTCYQTADLDEAPDGPDPQVPRQAAPATSSEAPRGTVPHSPAGPSGTARGTVPRAAARPSGSARRTVPHDRREPRRNPKTEKATAAVSLFPDAYHDDLNDDQQRVVRSAFPYGCTPAQFRRLMQAVVAAEREGCTASFIAYGVRVVIEDDDAPWDALARQVEFLKEDMRRAVVRFEAPLFRIPDFRDWLQAHRQDPEVRAWIQEVEARRMRCNCLLVWRHDL